MITRSPWVAHFGLTATPFAKSIPTADLFAREAHVEAMARIAFLVIECALGVIAGDVGVGKTVSVRAAVGQLDPLRFHPIYVANPMVGTRGLYVAIVSALGATPRFHRAEVMAQAAELLAAEEAERHRRVVFVIDEAHLLTPEQLEEIRLLTNAAWTPPLPSPASWWASPRSSAGCGWGSSRRSTSASPPASPFPRWTSGSRPPTCATTSDSSGGPTRCSRTTPLPGCTASPTGFPVR
jgi:Type II secretory pathway, component ExeA (predicted ATPase)